MLTKQQILEVEKNNGSRNLTLRREFNKQVISAGDKKKKKREKENKPKPIKKKKRKLTPWNKFVKHVLSYPGRYNLIPTSPGSGKYRLTENAGTISHLWKEKKKKDARESNTMKENPDEFDDPNEYLSDDVEELERLAADLDEANYMLELEHETKEKGQMTKDRIKSYMERNKNEIKDKYKRARERELLSWQNRPNRKFDERRAREFEKQLGIKRG